MKQFIHLSIQLFAYSLIVFAGFQTASSQNNPPKIEIRGKIIDAKTGDAIAGVSVSIAETFIGTASDNLGFYSLSLNRGNYTVSFSSLGYELKELKINADKSRTIDVELNPNSQQLEEVIVSARAKDENVKSLKIGVERMSMKEIRHIPVLMGEVDMLKAIQLLPGVNSTSEGGSGFSVRGGSPDQNLILLDDATVYNASHLMGFFSVFNNDVMEGLELYKGDLPMKYGGRLSSLLKVDTKTELPPRFRGTGGVGLISTRLMLEGAVGAQTSWIAGGRRSYADIFLKLSGDEYKSSSGLYFYDFNAKITHRFSRKDRLELSGYYGRDVFVAANVADFKYGNAATALNWRHLFSDRIYSKISFNLSKYNYGINAKLDPLNATLASEIFDIGLRFDITHHVNRLWNLDYGVSSTVHDFNPGNVSVQNYNVPNLERSKALEHGAYLANEQKFTDKFSLRYGLRLSIFQSIGKTTVFNYDDDYQVVDSTVYGSGKIYNTYSQLEPRIALAYFLNKTSSVKANYARNTQFVQLAENSAAGSPVSIWFPASPNIKPQTADMFSAGYFRNFNDNMYETSVEAYYKLSRNVIDFADHAELLLNPYLEGEIRTGKGVAYGVEFTLRKNSGKLTGFLNYTLSRSERNIPEINEGKTYLAPYDKTHAFNISLNYELSRKLNVSATWVYSTGTPVTYPTGRFEIDGEYFPIYSGRNEYRRPDYHRLDLSLNFVPKPYSRKRWKGEWNFSVYNAYWRKNPWIITYNQAAAPTPTAEMMYLFGIVPSVTYNFKF